MERPVDYVVRLDKGNKSLIIEGSTIRSFVENLSQIADGINLKTYLATFVVKDMFYTLSVPEGMKVPSLETGVKQRLVSRIRDEADRFFDEILQRVESKISDKKEFFGRLGLSLRLTKERPIPVRTVVIREEQGSFPNVRYLWVKILFAAGCDLVSSNTNILLSDNFKFIARVGEKKTRSEIANNLLEIIDIIYKEIKSDYDGLSRLVMDAIVSSYEKAFPELSGKLRVLDTRIDSKVIVKDIYGYEGYETKPLNLSIHYRPKDGKEGTWIYGPYKFKIVISVSEDKQIPVLETLANIARDLSEGIDIKFTATLSLLWSDGMKLKVQGNLVRPFETSSLDEWALDALRRLFDVFLELEGLKGGTSGIVEED